MIPTYCWPTDTSPGQIFYKLVTSWNERTWSSWSGKCVYVCVCACVRACVRVCVCVQCMCVCLFIYVMFTWSTILSYSCTHHTTLTIHVLFLYASHYTYYICHISVCITLHLLYMSHLCTYHTMHTLTVHVTLLYVSHCAYAYCVCHMYRTTLTIHVTFLYVSHCAYCTCHISVCITLRLLYMSHFCTYHTTLTIHVTFLYVSHYTCAYHITVRITLCMLTVHFTFLYTSHYTYCTCHISVCITLCLLYMSHFCTYYTTLTVHITFLHYAYAYCVCITLCSLCHTDNLLAIF